MTWNDAICRQGIKINLDSWMLKQESDSLLLLKTSNLIVNVSGGVGELAMIFGFCAGYRNIANAEWKGKGMLSTFGGLTRSE